MVLICHPIEIPASGTDHTGAAAHTDGIGIDNASVGAEETTWGWMQAGLEAQLPPLGAANAAVAGAGLDNPGHLRGGDLRLIRGE